MIVRAAYFIVPDETWCTLATQSGILYYQFILRLSILVDEFNVVHRLVP